MILLCPRHGSQDSAAVSNNFYELINKGEQANVQEVIFYFKEIIGIVYWKCSNEVWGWLKDEITEEYFDEHYNGFISYPKVICQKCLNEYLCKHKIMPEIIKVNVLD